MDSELPEPEGLPLTLFTGNGNAVIHESNGYEIVLWLRRDWGFEGPGVENFPNYVKSLIKYYEQPEDLLKQETPLEHRPRYSSQNDIPFEVEPLPSEPVADQSQVDEHRPFSVTIDTEAPFPDDQQVPPDHEVRIEDGQGNVWHRVRTEECDAFYQENEGDAPEAVAQFTMALRLMYEKPRVFVSKYS